MIWPKEESHGEEKTKRGKGKWKLDHLLNQCAINARLLKEKEKLWLFVQKTKATNKHKVNINLKNLGRA